MRSVGDFQTIHPCVHRSVRAHARKLFRSGKIPDASLQDLEQEFYVAFLPKHQKYDRHRSSYRTFVERVVGNRAATLIKAAQAQKRGQQYETISFSHLEVENENGEVLDAEDVIGRKRLHNGLMPAVEDDAIIVSDVRRAIRKLPPHLRQTCSGLVAGTVSDAAKSSGVSQWTIHHRKKAIRQHFVAARLDGYLAGTPQIPISSGK